MNESCRLPTRAADDEEAVIRRLLASRRIAVVGLSNDPSRPSNDVAAYLISAGYDVIPVNPTVKTALGRRCVATLAEVNGPIDLVNVFRRPEHCPGVVREAIAAGAKGVWLQQGIVSEESRQLAAEAGIDFIEDRCLKVEHMRRG